MQSRNILILFRNRWSRKPVTKDGDELSFKNSNARGLPKNARLSYRTLNFISFFRQDTGYKQTAGFPELVPVHPYLAS